MTTEPTPELVVRFWDEMAARYGTRIVDKSSALEMPAVAWFLERLGVLDAKAFLERFTTTIGRRIYVPFTPGEATPRHGLWSQIVVCVHEHQHVEQARRDGPAVFSLRYLASRAARAAYETEAYRCDLELHHWRTGQLLDPRALARRLRNYGLRDADIQVAEQILIASARTIRLGGLLTPAAKYAIAWLEEHAPGLKRHLPS